MNNQLTISRYRFTKLICLLVAVMMLATTDAMAAKKKKKKGKGKQPVATQPATPPTDTATEKAAETAAPAPAPVAAPAPAEAPAPAPAPAFEATAVSTSVTTTETTTTEAVVQPAPHPEPQPTEQAMVATAPVADPGAPLGEPAPSSDEGGWKFRAGMNVGFMYFLPGPSYGANVSARVGMHFSDLLSAYIDGGAGFGLGGGASSTPSGGVKLSGSAAGFYRVGLMGELKFGPLFFAIGPALFNGTYDQIKVVADSSGTGSHDELQTVNGMYPAVLARLGLSFGKRNHFTLAVEGMAVLGSVTKVETSTGTTGKTGGSVMALSPTVVLGWDLN